MMALPPPRGIMTNQNIFLPLKRETKLLNAIYMDLHTKRKVNLLYLVKDQLIILSNHGWQNHRRVCPDTLSRRLLQERLNQESILVEIVRPSIWQLRGSQGCKASTVMLILLHACILIEEIFYPHSNVDSSCMYLNWINIFFNYILLFIQLLGLTQTSSL